MARDDVIASLRDPTLRISRRKAEILLDLANGMVTKEIAQARNLSAHTVAEYIERLELLLRARSRAHLISRAYEHGFLPLDQGRFTNY
ncbi:MAG: LuxR C-terminal-related transcriptional regulator [Gemmatimonadales bacterium]